MPKNEWIFFKAFAQMVGGNYLKAKALGSKISSDDVFLDTCYFAYDFPKNVSKMFASILKDFSFTPLISAGSLAHHIDGLLNGHPKLGRRIVEFDEEQHFSPFRHVTLTQLASITDAKYIPHFVECCTDLNCFRRMLKKHRVPADKGSTPADLTSFMGFLQSYGDPSISYQSPKPAFNYTGGRIAQRAYYDTLRDVAHLAKQNVNLGAPLRFSLFEFEKKSGLAFHTIAPNTLCSLIKARLAELV